MAKSAGLTNGPVAASDLENLSNVMGLKDVDFTTLKQCKDSDSIMAEDRKEADQTFSYADILRLRLLYQWQQLDE